MTAGRPPFTDPEWQPDKGGLPEVDKPWSPFAWDSPTAGTIDPPSTKRLRLECLERDLEAILDRARRMKDWNDRARVRLPRGPRGGDRRARDRVWNGTQLMAALYREYLSDEWQDCELIGRHPSGNLVLREVGKLWPGIWLAPVDAVRVPASAIALQLRAD